MIRFMKSQAGDTIVEVLIAIAVMSMVLGGAYALTSNSVKGNQNSQEHSQGLKVAEQHMERLKSFIAGGGQVPAAGSEFCMKTTSPNGTETLAANCKFDDRYTVKIKESTTIDNSFTVSVTWDGPGGASQQVSLTYRAYEMAAITPTTGVVVSPTTVTASIQKIALKPGDSSVNRQPDCGAGSLTAPAGFKARLDGGTEKDVVPGSGAVFSSTNGELASGAASHTVSISTIPSGYELCPTPASTTQSITSVEGGNVTLTFNVRPLCTATTTNTTSTYYTKGSYQGTHYYQGQYNDGQVIDDTYYGLGKVMLYRDIFWWPIFGGQYRYKVYTAIPNTQVTPTTTYSCAS